MRRVLSVLVVGPLSAAAAATFAYQLLAQLLFYVASVLEWALLPH